MIALDTATLRFRAMNVQGCYMYGVDSKIKEVLLNGVKNVHVYYCDVNNGFAITHKTSIDGTLVRVEDELIYDVFFGDVEVIHELEKPTN